MLTLFIAVLLIAEVPALEIPARTVPAPAGASPELQEIIRNAPARMAAQVPQSYDEWLARIDQVNKNDRLKVDRILERTGLELVPDKLAGVKIYRVEPSEVLAENRGQLFVYIHGGAYVYGDGGAGQGEAVLIAERVGVPVVAVEYRKPPDHPFPAGIEDVVAVYSSLLTETSPKSIIIGGTSSGAGMTLAVVQRLSMLELPLPGAIFAGSPWADLTKTGDTLYTLEGVDRILSTYEGPLGAAARLYAGDNRLTHPLISPVYAIFDGFPPTMFVSGTRDMFLSDTVRTHRKMREAGVVADLHVFEGMSHAGYWIAPSTPESGQVYEELKTFMDRHLR